ncbi:uncharacterized protein LOC132752620 [Ruditapes philippinarum]|uniref:uncharacterized protein LOC132752620 n=1 Tax=Ruditapes philippinarum TaxID=129788 RepID=UPI00295AD78F|nr:uncharacterized protein LOC132752620 [Ruditapes philippinarum]
MGFCGIYCVQNGKKRSEITVHLYLYIFILISYYIHEAHGFKDYHTCLDVKKDLGSKAVDGEYIIFLPWLKYVGITVYCHNLQSSDLGPESYITLKSGRSSNFASFYENVGVPNYCADAFPRKLYSAGGRTEFSKIAVSTIGLDVQPGDFTFANHSGVNKIRFGSAGDNWTSSDTCFPMGAFQIDLTGTPFTVVASSQWQWAGRHVRGNLTGGYAHINNHSYIGCFADKRDRLLPAGRQDSANNRTIQNCIQHCKNLKYAYAGVEYGVECHCGNDYGRYGTRPVSENNCNKKCSGNPQQICGGTWFAGIYATAIPQRITGHCGGFPGQCYPATTYDFKEENLHLDLMHNQHICVKSNPCQNEGRCLAVDADAFKCICYQGYSGTNCEIVKSEIIDDGRTCPAGYQAETCLCFESKCNGAKFEGDTCVTSTGHSQVICRPGDPGHVILFNVNGLGTVQCPAGAVAVGCSYWTTYAAGVVHGQSLMQRGICGISNNTVAVQARCKQYMCGCMNGGHCNKVTGECECPPSYYGSKCETFDYCSYYEDINNRTACDAGGVCVPVHKEVVNTIGGDKAGDTCIFPFDYGNYTFNTCVEDNSVGPPFSCAGEFALSDTFKNGPTYIDLGPWSPGPRYTVAAWVRPDRIDTMRQTIVGGASDCNDFGFNFNSGTFRGYLKLSKECTRDLNTGKSLATIGTWYMVAVTSNASHAKIYLNGQFKEMNTVLLNHIPTTAGFWIGSAVCCPADFFRGMIKNVKVWNRELTNDEINRSMYNIGTQNSTVEALNDGLVGHWELGDIAVPACSGGNAVDHGGDDWILKDTEIIGGIHCNISRFVIPKGVTVLVSRYNGSTGGMFDVIAQEVQIDGYLDAVGAGYRGAPSSNGTGVGGSQGETYSGIGKISNQQNYGGGGGGAGGNTITDGTGRSGGGGGYGSVGLNGIKVVGDRIGLGSGGRVYGDADLNTLYMGSGGGSGGNAKDLTTNPIGGRGGNGGGAVKIIAERSIKITGVISVAGENGQGDIPVGSGCMGCPDSCDLKSPVRCLGNSTTACWDMSGPGGGGSGGSIYLSAKLVDIGYQKLWAMGGDGGAGGSHCCGGPGGMGRIRIDSLITKGIVGDNHGVVKTSTLQDQFVDHSQSGQKQIDYRNTVYGNEVFRGCFRDIPTNRTLAIAIPSTSVTNSKMTPDYCKQLCRDRNFKYSGTEGTNLCFCDNHLDMSKKVHDSECGQACQGNPLWTCGGTNRLQVFGPPPGAPATGHNVLSKCVPWCVTADAGTDNPKWGQCIKKPPSVTSWDVKCECSPGKTGPNCDQQCPSWTYGTACRRNCTCNQSNTAMCDPINGVCVCKSGFKGTSCQDKCPDGYYGEGCKHACNCSSNAICDHMTGNCACQPGWMGPGCNFPCPVNTYGVNCSQSCSNRCSHGTCNPEDGTCQCYPGYGTQFCSEKCEPFSYGQDCLQSCDCSGQKCDPFTGRCICGNGYTGNKCESICRFGTYGLDCAKKCACQNGAGCDHITGECYCARGYRGETCGDACSPGQFGDDCGNTCSCVASNTLACDIATGKCTCKPGFYGNNCELPCEDGYYGNQCLMKCTCKNGGVCDKASGTCSCQPGFRGDSCETPCSSGYYGQNCGSRCPMKCPNQLCNIVDGSCSCSTGLVCHCPVNTAGKMSQCDKTCSCVNGQCLVDTATCKCNPGWKGTKCDVPCDKGTYGLNCGSTCNCMHGSCNQSTGSCYCYSGYSGAKCDIPCKNNSFGPGCKFACPDCGPQSLPACDVGTGVCMCRPGYTGSKCERPCPDGTFGLNCSKTCSCQNGICDHIAGACVCDVGFTGNKCQTTCPSGQYGLNCQKTCDCGPHGSGCSPKEGLCICKPGFTGVKCRHSCPVGFYGQNCTNRCSCDPYGSSCSPIDGSCLCKSGYTGQYCEEVCGPGFWGKGCTQACECNGRGSCNPFNGQCDCIAGFKGDRCETQCAQDIFWGKNCANACSCNGEHCDHRDGTCRCPPGKIGHHCEKGCNTGYFGFQCAQVCGCKHNSKCDPVTGSCRCQPGWSGQFCDKACPDGFYGVDCAGICPDCWNDGSCDTFAGTCICTSGYTGQYCNTSLITGNQQQPESQPQTNTVSTAGVQFTVSQFVGFIVGFLLLLVFVTVMAVLLTRRCSAGRFGGTEGVVKFRGEELDIATASAENSGVTNVGFVNPVHEASFNETELDSKSVTSDATSGVASAMVDSDDEDDGFFKDSKA